MSFKAGICGIGRIAGDDHIPMLKRVRGFDLIAAYDITPARRLYAEYAYKIKAYSDFNEFLKLGLDLVVISSPSSTHKKLAMQAINKGINVVIEKPIALNSRDAKAIIDLAKKKKVLLSVYHNRRWDGDFTTVRKLLKQGLVGKPLVIESGAASFGSLKSYAVQEFNPLWRYRKSYGGGVLLDFGTHLVDQLLQLVKDKPRSVWCATKNVLWSKEVEDYFECVIRFHGGITARLYTSQVSRYSPPRWRVTGTHGAIICENLWKGPIKVKYDSDKHMEGREHVCGLARVKKDIFYKNILGALRNREDLLVKPDEVYKVMVVLDAAKESARTGKEVKIKF